MGIETLIGAGASILGGVMGSNASKDAANTQANAANQASQTQLQASRESNALQKEMFDKQTALQEPFRQNGLAASNMLASRVLGGDLSKSFDGSSFTGDPGYQFRLGEGQKAVENSAAARGSLLSGGAMKALQKYGQDFASNEYNNAYNRFNTDQTNQYNRLAGLAGSGQTATNNMGAAASNYGSNVGNNLTSTAGAIGNNMMGAGNAQAAGMVGSANAWSNGIGGAIGNYQQNQLMNLMADKNKSPYTIY